MFYICALCDHTVRTQEYDMMERCTLFCPQDGMRLMMLVCPHCGEELKIRNPSNWYLSGGSNAIEPYPYCLHCGEKIEQKEPQMLMNIMSHHKGMARLSMREEFTKALKAKAQEKFGNTTKEDSA